MRNEFNIKTRYLVLLFLAFLVLYGLMSILLSDFESGPLILSFFDLVFLALVLLFMYKRKISLKRILGKVSDSVKWFRIIGIVVLTLILSVGIGMIESLFLPILISLEDIMFGFGSTLAIIGSVLSMVVFMPFIEELFFRGIIFQRWALKWSIGSAIILSSLFFGILHMTTGAFIFGIVMCLLYLRTRTLIVPVIAHLINNLLAIAPLIGTIIFQGSESINEFANEFSAAPSPLEIKVAITIIAISLPFVIIYIYKNWPSKEAELPYFANK